MRTSRVIASVSVALALAAGCGPKGDAKEPDKEPIQDEADEVVTEQPVETQAEAVAEQPVESEEEAEAEAEEPEAEMDKGPQTITLATKAKLGKVTLAHHVHQDAFDCTSCHHAYQQGETMQTCHSCHGVDKAAPAAKDALHKTCQDCHKDSGGPAKCAGCHKK